MTETERFIITTFGVPILLIIGLGVVAVLKFGFGAVYSLYKHILKVERSKIRININKPKEYKSYKSYIELTEIH